MRYVFIRLLMIATMLSGAGHTLATTVYIQGALSENVTYHVYDGALMLNGFIDHWGIEKRIWGGWFIYNKDRDDAVANPCSKKYDVWTHDSIDLFEWTNFPFADSCHTPITWLDAGQTHYWFDSPNYNLVVGPEGEDIQADASLKHTNAPTDLKWIKGVNYNVRLFAFSNAAGAGAHQSTERTIKYMGAPSAVDNTQANQADKNPGSYQISITSSSPVTNSEMHYIMSCETWVHDKDNPVDPVTNTTSTWQTQSVMGAEGMTYHTTLDLHLDGTDSHYKVGHTYHAQTVCQFKPNDEIRKSHVIFKFDKRFNKVFDHEFEVAAGGKPVRDGAVKSTVPIIISLTGQFLENGGIRVLGKFDDSSPDQPPFKYAVEETVMQSPRWISPGDTVSWNPGDIHPRNCPKCFLFDIPADKLPAKDKIAWVQILPDTHSPEQERSPGVVQFNLSDFITANFMSSTGFINSCGLENHVAIDHASPVVKLKLIVNRAIDQISGIFHLPVETTYKGGGTVLYSEQFNPEQESEKKATQDIVLSAADTNKSVVNFSTAYTVLKPGAYFISLPVSVPRTRQVTIDTSPEEFVLGVEVNGAGSLLLMEEHPFQDPEPVRCGVTWYGP